MASLVKETKELLFSAILLLGLLGYSQSFKTPATKHSEYEVMKRMEMATRTVHCQQIDGLCVIQDFCPSSSRLGNGEPNICLGESFVCCEKNAALKAVGITPDACTDYNGVCTQPLHCDETHSVALSNRCEPGKVCCVSKNT